MKNFSETFLQLFSCADVPMISYLNKHPVYKKNCFDKYTDDMLKFKLINSQNYKNTIRYKYVLSKTERRNIGKAKQLVYKRIKQELQERENHRELKERLSAIENLKLSCKSLHDTLSSLKQRSEKKS
jgi:hypothetical protein